MGRLLAYMVINVGFDDNKPHVLDKQRITHYALKQEINMA